LTYVQTLKRIRSDKTNYRKRAALLIGRHSFVTVKVSDQNVAAQVLKPTPTGDIVIASAHSRELAKQDWKGAFNNLPACYLTGLLMGKKTLEKGVKNAVLYIGKDHFTSRVAACLKGIVDSGVTMPVSEESLPPEERITGRHIAKYASTLKEDQEEYNSRFSAILKNGLKPEDYPTHFEEVRSKISGNGKAAEPKPKNAEEEEEEEEEGEERKAEAPATTGKEKKKAITSAAKEEKKAPKEKKEKAPKKEAKKSAEKKGGKKK
jgi:large subunit ribosomal protein L18